MATCPLCGRYADIEPSVERADTATHYIGTMHCACSPEPFLVSRPRKDPSCEWRMEVAA